MRGNLHSQLQHFLRRCRCAVPVCQMSLVLFVIIKLVHGVSTPSSLFAHHLYHSMEIFWFLPKKKLLKSFFTSRLPVYLVINKTIYRSHKDLETSGLIEEGSILFTSSPIGNWRSLASDLEPCFCEPIPFTQAICADLFCFTLN